MGDNLGGVVASQALDKYKEESGLNLKKDAPKRPLTSFMLYLNDNRARIKASSLFLPFLPFSATCCRRVCAQCRVGWFDFFISLLPPPRALPLLQLLQSPPLAQQRCAPATRGTNPLGVSSLFFRGCYFPCASVRPCGCVAEHAREAQCSGASCAS